MEPPERMADKGPKQKQNLEVRLRFSPGRFAGVVPYRVEKTVAKFRDLAEAEKADCEFYRKLSGQERLDILLQSSKHEPEIPFERAFRVIKFRDVDDRLVQIKRTVAGQQDLADRVALS